MVEIRIDGPVRTCVGCRQRAAKRELLRVTLVAGEVVPDVRGTASGRGAHLHPTPTCFALAERKRAFARALKHSGGRPLDLERVRRHVETNELSEEEPQEMEH